MPYQSEPFLLPPGLHFSTACTLLVDPGTTGSVEIQFRDALGSWFTPTDTAYTVTEKTAVTIVRMNTPERRIIANGDAQFQITVGQQ